MEMLLKRSKRPRPHKKRGNRIHPMREESKRNCIFCKLQCLWSSRTVCFQSPWCVEAFLSRGPICATTQQSRRKRRRHVGHWWQPHGIHPHCLTTGYYCCSPIADQGCLHVDPGWYLNIHRALTEILEEHFCSQSLLVGFFFKHLWLLWF